MNPREILIKIMKRGGKERGIRIMSPNPNLSKGHIEKADHNLIVMTDLQKLGHEDWVVTAAYYAMYHSAMALLARIGIESKDHAATAAALDYFFGKDISKDLLRKFCETMERKEKIERLVIEGRYISNLWKAKREREKTQYGISLSYTRTEGIIKDARNFASRMKLIRADMDEKIVEELVKRAKELKDAA